QKKRYQQLQQRPTPQPKRSPKPSKQVMPSLVDHEVHHVNKKTATVCIERIDQKPRIENEPRRNRQLRNRLPACVQYRLEVVEHNRDSIHDRACRHITNVRDSPAINGGSVISPSDIAPGAVSCYIDVKLPTTLQANQENGDCLSRSDLNHETPTVV